MQYLSNVTSSVPYRKLVAIFSLNPELFPIVAESAAATARAAIHIAARI